MTFIGCTKQNRVAFESTIGRTVDTVQIYAGTDTPPTGEWATVTSLANAGYKVCVTYNSSFSLAQIISGSEDSRTLAIANFLNALPTVGYVGFMHESEDEGFVAATFRAAASRVYGILNANLSSGWKTVYTFLGGFRDNPATTNNQFTNGPPSNWWPTPNQPDLIGVDYYNWRGASNTAGDRYADPLVPDRNVGDLVQTTTGGVNTGIDSYMEFANSLTPVPKLCFPEFGCPVEDNAGGPALRAAWIQSFANAYHGDSRIEFVNYYDLDQLSSPARVNWRISGGQEPAESASGAAFAAIGGHTTTLAAGTTTISAETIVAEGDVLEFPPNSSATLIMDNKNLIVYGTLRMRPANANVIHTLRFINVNEAIMVGGGMVPLATDVGLWVMGNGVADWIGTTKKGWNRTGDDPSWAVGDEMKTAPWGPVGTVTPNWASPQPHVKGAAPQTITDPWGGVHTNEVMNLTRNVRIEGTAGHNTHVFIRTDVPQTIKYVQLRFVGPRTPLPPGNQAISNVIVGRWGMHLHHLMEAGRTTTIIGCVVRDNPTHAFVAHDSHGVLFQDCIAYDVSEAAFWWDKTVQADASFDVVYDHCMTVNCTAIPPYRGSGLTSFDLSHGTGGVITDCVATGGKAASTGSGFLWPEEPGLSNTAFRQAVWDNHNNVAHNNVGLGIQAWQNSGNAHRIDDFVAFRNLGGGIRFGAYLNHFQLENLTCFENYAGAVANGFMDLVTVANNSSSPPNALKYHNLKIGTWAVRESVLTNGLLIPSTIHDSIIEAINVSETEDTAIDEVPRPGHQYDFVNTNLEPADWTIIHANAGSKFRVQRRDATAYRVNVDGSITVIAPFSIFVTTLALTVAAQNAPYTQQLQRSLGTTPISWRLQTGSGPLPAGISLSSLGVLSGTPTTAGTYPFTVEAVDASGIWGEKLLTMQVGASVSLQITTSSLPNGVKDSPYTGAQLAATGGIAPRTFSIVSGSLPAGLSLASNGAISGTPTAAGVSVVTFRVTDAVAATAQRQLSITVADLSPVISTQSLPFGEVGLVYLGGMTATAGVLPYTWSVILGPLPPGITMGTDGIFAGTPTTPGTYPVRIQVNDGGGHGAQHDYTFTVFAALDLPEVGQLPDAYFGEPYSVSIPVNGGASPRIFSIAEESLESGRGAAPQGISITPEGLLFGISEEVGPFSFVIAVTDGLQAEDSITVDMNVLVRTAADEEERGSVKSFGLRRPHGGSRVRDRV